MENLDNNKNTSTKVTSTKDRSNLNYDFEMEYGDGDIPNVDKPNTSSNSVKPDDVERRDGPGGE